MSFSSLKETSGAAESISLQTQSDEEVEEIRRQLEVEREKRKLKAMREESAFLELLSYNSDKAYGVVTDNDEEQQVDE